MNKEKERLPFSAVFRILIDPSRWNQVSIWRGSNGEGQSQLLPQRFVQLPEGAKVVKEVNQHPRQHYTGNGQQRTVTVDPAQIQHNHPPHGQ